MLMTRMTMTARKQYATVLLGILVSACGGSDEENKPAQTPTQPVAMATPPPPVETQPVEPIQAAPAKPLSETIPMVAKNFSDAMNSHEVSKVTALYTEDAIITTPGLPDAR